MGTRKTGVETKELVLEVASQGTMGVALGLTFAFTVILIPAKGVSAVITKAPSTSCGYSSARAR